MNTEHRRTLRADREWQLEALEEPQFHVEPVPHAGLIQARKTLAARKAKSLRFYRLRLVVLASLLATVSAYAGGLLP